MILKFRMPPGFGRSVSVLEETSTGRRLLQRGTEGVEPAAWEDPPGMSQMPLATKR